MKQVITIHIERPISSNEKSIIEQTHPLIINEMLNEQKETIYALFKEEGIQPEHFISITNSFVGDVDEN